jgi:superfamily II DNA/RNA helicase
VQAGVPAVELHGNLAQNARNRNMAAFSDGSAQTLVATDIAARGIHVDDIAIVIHADPPVEHKAYLHRSGRTARAGAQGTVITLMTDDQQSEVRDLTRKAGIKPTTSKARPGDALLAQLAPGERTYSAPVSPVPEPIEESNGGGQARRGRGAGRPNGARAATTGGTRAAGGGGRGTGARNGGTRGAGGDQPAGARTQSGRSQPSRTQGTVPRGRRGGTGSTPVHTTQSPTGGAAAFSARSRAAR